jgi:TonB-dependent receptor
MLPSSTTSLRSSLLRPVRALRLASFGLALASALHADTIVGRVTDANTQAYLPGTSVFVRELSRTVVADREGQFVLRNVPAGTYTLEASYLGYDPRSTTVTVSDGGVARATLILGEEVRRMAAFVIEGNREGQARALQVKRTAPNVVDIVSADSIGKLPDGNAAEAVRRLPGVFAEIDQGEGRYVVVRGIDSNLNNVTIDGQAVGSPQGEGRAVALDAVPADLISRIDVVKAVTPDMDHGAIGASVNIATPSAFDRDGTFVHASGNLGYNEKSGDSPTGASVLYGTTFGADRRWGVVLGASYSNRQYRSDRMSTGAWQLRGPHYVPVTQSLFLYGMDRTRLGFTGSLEFRPREGIEWYLRSSHNTFQDYEERQLSDVETLGTLSEQTATSGRFSGGRGTKEFRLNDFTQTIASHTFGGRLESGDGELDFSVNVGLAREETPERVDWEFRSSTSALPLTYDTSGELFLFRHGDNFARPEAYPFRRVRRRTDDEREDSRSAAVNYRREAAWIGQNGFWKVGARWVNRDREVDRTNNNYVGAQAFHLGSFDFTRPEPSGFFEGFYRIGPLMSYDAVETFFRNRPEFFRRDDVSSANDSTLNDYSVDETVTAGYAMAGVDTPFGSLLGGVRVEQTSGDYGGLERRPSPRPLRRSSDYTNAMPGLHWRYAPNRAWVFRAGWTNTVGRPNYPDIVPTRDFDFSEVSPGRYTGSVSGGNPALDPYESMNIDVAAEYYLSASGVVSVGFFHKRIENPVYTRSDLLENVTFDGLAFDRLVTSRPENAESGKITGFELNLQQQLTALPSPFDGLGISVNHTIVDSEARITSDPAKGRTDKLPFFKQADAVTNLALFYEKYRVSLRVAVSQTGDYLTGASATPGGQFDSYRLRRTLWDAKASYRLTDRWRLFGEWQNINDEPLANFSGVSSRRTASEIYDWTLNFGVNWSL